MAAFDDICDVELIDLCQETAEDKTQPSRNVYQAHHLSEVQVTGEVGSVMPCQVSIKHDKLPLLESMLEKVEKNYCVKISIDTHSARSNGKAAPVMQRISISGSKGDCRNAGVRLFSFCSVVTSFKSCCSFLQILSIT